MNELIKKDNRMIVANYKLPIMEQRLLWAVLGSVRSDDKDFESYSINIKDLAVQFGLQANKDLYRDIQLAARDLKNREIELPPNGRRKRFVNWLSYVEYEEGTGEVTVCFHASLKPYLLQLQNNFTCYALKYVIKFKSQYSIRFYEFLKMEEFKGKGGEFYFECTLEELRTYLFLANNEYSLTADLRRFVIEPALKEIQNQTDLEIVGTEYIKKGRAIHAIKITAQPKPPQTEPVKKTKRAREAKPLRVKFAGLELVTFNQLKQKYPTLTEGDIYDLSEKHQMEIFPLMQKMLSSDSGDFGLELTD